jgi:hypothetical protein
MGKDKKDMLTMGPELEDGRYPYIRERPDGTMSTGLVGPPCADGQPMGDALFLKHDEGPVFEVVHEHHGAKKAKGPVKVTTDAYRSGWDGIFGSKTVGQA